MSVRNIFLFISFSLFLSCSKEVKIDIPGFTSQLVVDGTIETNGNPLVLLSQSANIYSETNLSSYLNNFITNADVKVVYGLDTFNLSPMNIGDLPLASQKKLAEMLEIGFGETILLPIKVYSNIELIATANSSYELIIDYNSKTYKSTTFIPLPSTLENLYWKPEISNPLYGKSWARLSDNSTQYDAYKWEVRRINKNSENEDLDLIFRKTNDAYFDDRFFNGQSFDFSYDNPLKRKDSTHLLEYKRYFRMGDSVVVKFSKMDLNTFTFFQKKSAQLSSNGNPFGSPINITSTISGGALGIWAGFSPYYDTLYCIP
jgi:hypothetical protein